MLARERAVLILLAGGLAFASNGCTSASSPRRISAANVIQEFRQHEMVEVKTTDPSISCGVGAVRHGAFQIAGILDVKPRAIDLGGGDGYEARTDALIEALPTAHLASACAKAMNQATLVGPTKDTKRLTPEMWVAVNTGGPGSEPLSQAGVVTDGMYGIVFSHGRLVALGLARNRPDADRVDSDLHAIVAAFPG
jgi:hypothetical protein